VPRLRPSWQPGFLVPVLLAAMLITDVALRLALQTARISYRVWEGTRRFGAEAPFYPNVRYDRPRVYGNLAATGNLREFRQYHRVVFTSDSLGYHNPPDLAARGGVAALLFGRSFSAGTEVNDNETLSAHLTRLSGRPVYNAAPGNPVPTHVAELAGRLGMDGGVVILEHLESTDAPPIESVRARPVSAQCRRLLGPWSTPSACAAFAERARRLRVSPLAVFATRGYRRLQDDRWLPNAAASLVVRERLANGREMLFWPGAERLPPAERRSNAAVVRHATWLAARLALQRRDLLVVLVPEKYTVYGPLLEREGARRAAEETAASLDRLEQQLRERRIPVVNATGPLRAAARTSLAHDTYVYWLDDTHWNAAGVRVTAEAVAPELDRLWARQRRLPPR